MLLKQIINDIKFLLNHQNILSKKMSIFTQSYDPITGSCFWEEKDDNYDYHQEVARSAFADMLHDHERNEKYYLALKKAIDSKHKQGLKANVLDIGTGTGLLSMMAAKCGADSITACEAFRPMADCAIEIIKNNGFDSKINLIKKRSSDMTVGEHGDMKSRANILVTEVFDTELIGEGALLTFSHAHKVLLEKDCIVVPSKGIVYVQIVESEMVKNWNRINPIKDPVNDEVLIEPLKEINCCRGSPAVHDIQLTQLHSTDFKPLLNPQKIFEFDWSGKKDLSYDEKITVPSKCIASGTCHGLFMWWDLVMDDGDIILSCAPVWHHPDRKRDVSITKMAEIIPWRDHWMQSIYYFPKDIQITNDQVVYIHANHDEYSFWFDVSTDSKSSHHELPSCECLLHQAFSRTRISQINDEKRNRMFLNVLKSKIKEYSICLILSDGSLLSLTAAKLGAKHVIVFEPNTLSRNIIKNFIAHNQLKNIDVIQSTDEFSKYPNVNLIIGEPYYVNSIFPWDNLRFWFLASTYFPQVPTIPEAASLQAVVVEFKHLHKIRAPLGICESFDLTIFDKLVSVSSKISDSSVEVQPLWEYTGRALSHPFHLATFPFDSNFKNPKQNVFLGQLSEFEGGSCNGVAIWIDWHLDLKTVVTTGPTSQIKLGQPISWDISSRQGVFLLKNIKNIMDNSVLYWSLKYLLNRDGLFNFDFNFKTKKCF